MIKKVGAALLCAVLAMAVLGGCGTSYDPEESTLYIGKRGSITSVDVEELDQGYYDEEELGEYIEEAISDYTEANGKNSVKLKSFSVDGDMAKLVVKYKSVEDYASFNDTEFYVGKVVDSIADGYTYDETFVKVEDGAEAGSATKQDIYGEDGLKVVIISATTDVEVPGDIYYISSGNVTVTGTSTAYVTETDEVSYILYK